MTRNSKILTGVILLVCGIALIAWSTRDPDAAYREPPEVEKVVTIEQLPAPVQATVKRLLANGKLKEIKEESRGSEVKYEVEIISGGTETEYELAPDGSIIEQESKKLKRKSPTN